MPTSSRLLNFVQCWWYFVGAGLCARPFYPWQNRQPCPCSAGILFFIWKKSMQKNQMKGGLLTEPSPFQNPLRRRNYLLSFMPFAAVRQCNCDTNRKVFDSQQHSGHKCIINVGLSADMTNLLFLPWVKQNGTQDASYEAVLSEDTKKLPSFDESF